jgi:hypothetical protein
MTSNILFCSNCGHLRASHDPIECWQSYRATRCPCRNYREANQFEDLKWIEEREEDLK